MDPREPDEPALELEVRLRARRLAPHVPLDAETGLDGVAAERREERSGLPEELVPGTTYRDVRVDKRLLARLEPEEPAAGPRS